MTTSPRERLVRRIRDEQRIWRDLVKDVGRDRMNEPGPMGQWTFKDLVSHLAGWRNRTVGRIEAAAAGRPEPPAPWPADFQDDDPINAWIRARDERRSLEDVLADYDGSFDRLASAVTALPDDALMMPGRFSWMGDQALVDAPLFGHLHDEHEPSIRDWLASRPQAR